MRDIHFDFLVHSPLSRAAATAKAVWAGRTGPVHALHALREVDLHSWEGLTKSAVVVRDPAAFEAWCHEPHAFQLDGRWPIRNLWRRASQEAWVQILSIASEACCGPSALLVAHQGVNKALLGTALGLREEAFRRLPQVGGVVAATSPFS